MKLPRWIIPNSWTKPAVLRLGNSNLPLEVKNLTRQTLLADRLEVAHTSAKRGKGLLGRKGLLHGEGLWIVPCESVHTIGMQFPIDLVYVDRKHRIRKLRSNVPPWRISACLSAHSVIELPAGTIRNTQSRTGDQLDLSIALSPHQDAAAEVPADPDLEARKA